METMYDRLGDLLNETLQAGHVKYVKPKPVEKAGETPSEREESVQSEEEVKKEPEQIGKETSETKKNSDRVHFYRPEQKATGTIIKAIPPEIERACRLLGVTVNVTKEELKKAYKEKLQYYHPDKHAGNPILEKVAGDKTRQVVESYDLLSAYLAK